MGETSCLCNHVNKP